MRRKSTRGAPWLAAVALLLPAGARAQAPALAASPPPGLTLRQVVAAATAQNPLVEAAQARLEAAAGSRRSAATLPNPVVGWQAENLAFPGRSVPAGMEREVSALATLPLEALYQRGPRLRRATAELQVAQAGLSLARRSVGLEAARAFHRVALAQVTLAGEGDIQAGLEALAAYNAARVREGAAAEGDLIRVQVEQARAATEVVLARIELARAWAELKPYLPRSLAAADSPQVNAEETAEAAGALPDRSSLVERAQAARPDLLAGRSRVTAAREEAALQRALTLRQVGATLGTKRVGGTGTLVLGLSLPFPLFDQNRGEISRARAERAAAEQELAWVERTAMAEVEGAYASAALLSEQLGRLRGTFLGRAEEARAVALTAYREGAGSLLQVLDATRSLNEARATYYRVLFAQRQSLLELSVAAGGEPVLDLAAHSASEPTHSSTRLQTPGARP